MDFQSPLVSILITAYNRQDYLAECIESALSVTYPNIEIIIVDDASDDNTFEIAKGFCMKDARIKVFKNNENLGQFENRNKAASLATGKYLKYLDSDDKIYSNSISILISEILKEKEIKLIVGKKDLENDKLIKNTKQSFQSNFLHQSGIFGISPLSWLIETEFFMKIGGFKNQSGEGDYSFILNAALETSIIYLRLEVGYYREHEGQIDFIRRNNKLVQLKYLKNDIKVISLNLKKIGFILSLKILLKVFYTFFHVMKNTFFLKPSSSVKYFLNRKYKEFK